MFQKYKVILHIGSQNNVEESEKVANLVVRRGLRLQVRKAKSSHITVTPPQVSATRIYEHMPCQRGEMSYVPKCLPFSLSRNSAHQFHVFLTLHKIFGS